MVFKRREKRSWGSLLQFLLWPKGGWTRAAVYVKHRLHRLPDNPEKIARGIWAGVFTTFTPFYGLHFIVAGTIAFILRGNVLAALLATFFGNPLTYIPIGIISLRTGEFLLGSDGLGHNGEILVSLFFNAFSDLKSNLHSFIFGGSVEWNDLIIFFSLRSNISFHISGFDPLSLINSFSPPPALSPTSFSANLIESIRAYEIK